MKLPYFIGVIDMMTPTSNFQFDLDSIPVEILYKIFQQLSPQEKKVSALVCTYWRTLAENHILLLKDFKSEKDLSVRQLSILIGISQIDIDLQYKIALFFVKKFGSSEEPKIKI